MYTTTENNPGSGACIDATYDPTMFIASGTRVEVDSRPTLNTQVRLLLSGKRLRTARAAADGSSSSHAWAEWQVLSSRSIVRACVVSELPLGVTL
jgi:hypothetical protein